MGTAHAATTLIVDDDGLAAPGNCNAMTPTTSTIQAAVTQATPGDTVRVCPGTYAETVTVDKALTLKGAKAGVAAQGRSGSISESVVDPSDAATVPTFNITASDVRLDGFYLTGNENSPAVQTAASGSGYRIANNRFIANAFGLYFNASGDNPSVVSKNTFIANNENLGVASSAGNGIYSDQGLSGAVIQSNKFRTNVNAAVIMAGPASGVTASSNNSLGDGVFFAAYAGSGYRVLNNIVRNTSGSGIYFTNASGITAQQNNVTLSAFSGLRFSSGVSGAAVLGNAANGNGDQGISVSSEVSGAVIVRNNSTNNNNGDGILFSADTKGNLVRYNHAANNGDFDCEDLSTGSGTAGTANLWSHDTGATSNPPGLCSAS